MFLLFLALKAWRRIFGRRGATKAAGRDIYLVLEDLSGLPLDREPRVPDDDERAAGESVVTKIGLWIGKRTGSKQGVQATETELEFPGPGTEATGVDRHDGTWVDPQTGVLRQRTWEAT